MVIDGLQKMMGKLWLQNENIKTEKNHENGSYIEITIKIEEYENTKIEKNHENGFIVIAGMVEAAKICENMLIE